jgi:branched-chain amino acid transport system substrate-binding protein
MKGSFVRLITRRPTALTCGAAALVLLASACGGGASGGSSADGSGPVKVGSVLDTTGPLNIYGKTMSDATKLAINDINAHGGVLGRKLSLVSYDSQSNDAKYTQYVNSLAQRDKVSVIMGGITSASREAIRPIVDRTKTLYFYNEQYEGGVCDRDTFVTGVVPSQQLAALIPYAIQHFGKKIYVVAADYNYGHISADWVKKYAAQAGGQVVRSEFIPLDRSDFNSVINNLQSARPDVVLSLLVGGNHIAFYRQFAATGLGSSMHIASPTFGLGNEQVVLSPAESKGITVAFPYFQELSTPANQAFVNAWHTAYGTNYPYITDSGVAVWNGWHLWAAAVNQAKSLDRDKVTAALQSGIKVDAPDGTVTMDGPSHHVTQSISIGETNDKGFKILDTKNDVPPSYEQSVCDLVKNPNLNKQFTP